MLLGVVLQGLDLRENVSWREIGTDAHLPQPVFDFTNHIHPIVPHLSLEVPWVAAGLSVFLAELSKALLSKLHWAACRAATELAVPSCSCNWLTVVVLRQQQLPRRVGVGLHMHTSQA